jgi:hypothetical protein
MVHLYVKPRNKISAPQKPDQGKLREYLVEEPVITAIWGSLHSIHRYLIQS